jgi:acetate kinase
LNAITCHLGNGCSLAAICDGKSIDTTMGFTPLDGLVMGTRSGSVDPGILIHLLREENCTADRLDKMLNKESGLLGLSGISNDMRQILEAMRGGNARAQLAFDTFVHRLRAMMGSMIATLGGNCPRSENRRPRPPLDAIVFTAGIGENSPEVRAAACASFEFMGVRMDDTKNARCQADCDIAAADSLVRVLVIGAQEEWAIAKECWRLGIRN